MNKPEFTQQAAIEIAAHLVGESEGRQGLHDDAARLRVVRSAWNMAQRLANGVPEGSFDPEGPGARIFRSVAAFLAYGSRSGLRRMARIMYAASSAVRGTWPTKSAHSWWRCKVRMRRSW